MNRQRLTGHRRHVPSAIALALATIPVACRGLQPKESSVPPASTEAPAPATNGAPSKLILSAEEAVKLAREYATRLKPEARAKALQNLGVALAEQGNFPEAETLFRDAFEACRFIGEDRESATTAHLLNLNGALIRQSKFAEMLPVSCSAYTGSSTNSMLRFASLIGIARSLEGTGRVAESTVLYYVAAVGMADAGLAGKTNSAKTVQAEFLRMGKLIKESGVKPSSWSELRPTLHSLEEAAPGITTDMLTRLLIESVRRPEAANARALIASELKHAQTLAPLERGRTFNELASAITIAYGALGRPPESELKQHIQRLTILGNEILQKATAIGEQRFLHVALYRLASAEANREAAITHLQWLADSDAMQGFPIDGYREMLRMLKQPAPQSAGTVTSSEEGR